ncbi:hypothetical protein WJX77_008649 [Trebouxia sp. C0004]
MATFPKLKIKLGGKVFNEAEARASDAQPSGDANASSSSDTIDTQAGARSPTSHALAILSKLGAGRLGKGRQLMPPLPESWASLKDHLVIQQPKQARFVRPDPMAPSKGTAGKAQMPSRPSSKGTVKSAGLPSRPGRTDSDPMPDMPHAPMQQQVPLSISGQTAAPLKPGSSTVKGLGEKARGTTSGQQKPAWGAAQPAPNATQVAAARSYKRLRKSPSPALSEAAEQPLSAEVPMTGALPLSEPTRTAVLESPGTLRGYLEGTSKSGLSPMPFPISQRAAAATEQPVSGQGMSGMSATVSQAQTQAAPEPVINTTPPTVLALSQPHAAVAPALPTQTAAGVSSTQPVTPEAAAAQHGPRQSSEQHAAAPVQQALPVQTDVPSATVSAEALAALPAAPVAALSAALAGETQTEPSATSSPLPSVARPATTAPTLLGPPSIAPLPATTAGVSSAAVSAAAPAALMTNPPTIALASLPIAAQMATPVHQSTAAEPTLAAALTGQTHQSALAQAPQSPASSAAAAASGHANLPKVNQQTPTQVPVASNAHTIAQRVTSADQPTVSDEAALPSAYANLPGRLKPSLSMSMRPRSVAMGSKAKVPLKSGKLPIERLDLPFEPAGLPFYQHLSAAQPSGAVASAGAVTGHALQQSLSASDMPQILLSSIPAVAAPTLVAAAAHSAGGDQQTSNLALQNMPNAASSSKGRTEGAPALPMDRPEGSPAVPMGRADGNLAEPMGKPEGRASVPMGRADGSGAMSMGGRGMPGRQESRNGALPALRDDKQISGVAAASTVPRTSSNRDRDRHTSQNRDRRRSRSPRRTLSGWQSSRRDRFPSSSSSSDSSSRSSSTSRSRSPSTNRSRHRSRSHRSRTRSRDRPRGSTRDRDRGRAGGSSSWQKPYDRDTRGDPRGSRNPRNERQRDVRRSPDDRRGKEVHRGSSKQPRPNRRDEKDRYPVNDQGIVVSPDNIKRAREHREVKNVDGKWVKPEDTGLLEPGSSHRSSREPPSPLPSAAKAPASAVATAVAQKQPGRNAPKISPYPLGQKMSAFVATADKAKDTSPPAFTGLPAVVQPSASTTVAGAAASVRQTQQPMNNTLAAVPALPLPNAVTPAVPSSSHLAPIASAKLAATAQMPAATAQMVPALAQMPAATAQLAPATAQSAPALAQMPAPTADVTDNTAEEASADIYSPIRSPPAATLTNPSLPAQTAPLPVPRLNPLPLAPQPQYQPDSNAGIMPYATAEQVAAWQQQQAYQGYYGLAYPYTDPVYGYAYSQTQSYPVPGGGLPPAAPVGVAAPQPPPGGVPPPRPPPLGPNSPPPRRPKAAGPPPVSTSLPGPLTQQQGGSLAAAPAPLSSSALSWAAAPSSVPSSSSAPPAEQQGPLPWAPAPSPLPSSSWATPAGQEGPLPWALTHAPASAAVTEPAAVHRGSTEEKKTSVADARKQRLEALTERKARKDMLKQASGQIDQLKSQGSADKPLGPYNRPKSSGLADGDDAQAAPSQLPSRDTSSSDSARAGQSGARAGSDMPQGRPTQSLRHAASANAAAKPVANSADQIRGRLNRESSRSGTTSPTGAGAPPKGNGQRAAGASRLGPGREASRELPSERDQARLGKKRQLQAEGGPSGSQGSRHSPGPVLQSPAKKQKTAPLVPPGAIHIGLNAEMGDSFAAVLPLFSNPQQADMLASRPEHLAKQAADMLRKVEESERDPEGRPSGQAVQFALQACILHLHQAAVLAERRRSVDKSQLETLRSAVESCRLTLRMLSAATMRNPLQKLGYTMLTEILLAAALLRHGEAEQKLIDSAKAHCRLHMQSGAGLPSGGMLGSCGSLQRLSDGGGQTMPEDYVLQDTKYLLGYADRMSQYTKLTRKVHEHTAKLKALASSAMNGLKPDREDVESRLRMLNDKATCGKHVDLAYLARKALHALFRLGPDM